MPGATASGGKGADVIDAGADSDVTSAMPVT
jgi:hypothetical protein